MSPSTGTPGSASQTTAVPATNAISAAGTIRVTRLGARYMIASEPSPTASASAWTLPRISGMAISTAMGPPPGVGSPSSGATCRMMMIQPIPLMKPDTTVYGTSEM